MNSPSITIFTTINNKHTREMPNLLYDIFELFGQSRKNRHWALKILNYILLTLFVIFAVLGVISGIMMVFGWELPVSTPTKTTLDGFAGESLYDLMEKEAQISNDVYIQKIRDADVIQSNPWIMIEPVSKNATIHPRGVLDRLTGQQSDKLVGQPRSYYDYSDVLYTGLPL